jgi:2-polyprenyl-3-methyl-5-hydroxy-6-metoxy-1,4-benzoquinol methylase
MPLANALVPPETPAAAQPRFPLSLMRCERCDLAQLGEIVDPAHLFRNYNYLSSTSDAFVRHAKQLVDRLIAERRLNSGSQVVEIASNDGYLLRHYRALGVPVLGVEPAANIALEAQKRGIATVIDFFSRALAEKLTRDGRNADVLHANNVLAHVPDLRGVVAGIAMILKPGGIAVIEVPYLRDLVDRLEFDTIYHEHLCYFALTPLVRLFNSEKLAIIDVERVAVHGGSLRVFAELGACSRPSANVTAMLAEEAAWGVRSAERYRRFGDAVRDFRPRLRDFLGALRAQGKSIAAYGAAAKGATLLNYCGIGRETIDFAVDRSPLKQGTALPGVEIPVFAPEELARQRPDYLLLLAWNFADEIIAQQQDYAKSGGRFIVPVPTPRVIDGGFRTRLYHPSACR